MWSQISEGMLVMFGCWCPLRSSTALGTAEPISGVPAIRTIRTEMGEDFWMLRSTRERQCCLCFRERQCCLCFRERQCCLCFALPENVNVFLCFRERQCCLCFRERQCCLCFALPENVVVSASTEMHLFPPGMLGNAKWPWWLLISFLGSVLFR